MRSFVPAIYDATVAIPRNSSPPTMLGLFKGQSFEVSNLIARNLASDVSMSVVTTCELEVLDQFLHNPEMFRSLQILHHTSRWVANEVAKNKWWIVVGWRKFT